jgi:4-amino-4-deoxy-L-arabinose transferase-like glycosyltransferase
MLPSDRTETAVPVSRAEALPRWPSLRLGVASAGLLLMVCAAFTAAAALVLLIVWRFRPGLAQPELIFGLWARVLLFGFLAVTGAAMLIRFRPPFPAGKAAWGGRFLPGPDAAGLAAGLLFAAAFVLPHLAIYPWTGPDEVHHLTVAKNLAVEGVYASGHPETGLKQFDSFDSVGPPVLVPVAAAFRLGGASHAAARVVIALFFLVLCVLLYFFLRPLFGRAAAVLGVFLSTMAFSSIYLGRTLYGEVPAITFFLAGLLFWRQSLLLRCTCLAAFFAGVCFALAVLSKTILILSAFAFAGAWLFDLLTGRRIRLRHVLLPAAGFLVPMLAWQGCQWLAGGPTGEGGTFAIYQHYLLFGIGSFFDGLHYSLWEFPMQHVIFTLAFIMAVPVLFHDRYDPPGIVLFLTALFFVYWWHFFTPGQLPRYLWWSHLTATTFSGALFIRAVRTPVCGHQTGAIRRFAAPVAAALIIATPIYWTALQAREVYTNDEMRDGLELAAWIDSLPPDSDIAVTQSATRGELIFLTGRNPSAVDSPETASQILALLGRFNVIITTAAPAETLPPAVRRRQFGRYTALYTRRDRKPV